MERDENRLVMGLGAALGCALLVIAFLLGRVSAPAAVPVVIAPSVAPVGSAAALPPQESRSTPAAATPEAFELTPPVRPLVSAAQGGDLNAPPPVPARDVSPLPHTSRPPTVSPERQQVAAYFAEVDRVGDIGSGDPQAFAQSLMDSMTSGDFSRFDDLVTKARSQRDRLRAVSPPGSCAAHHRLALTLSNDSVTMLERMKTALMKGDTTALMSMATEGRALEAQANQLKAMGEAIKRQAGV